MENIRAALKMQRDAQRRRVLAPDYDPVRRDFDLRLADEMDREAQALLTPREPLQTGFGGEIIPPVEEGLPGLELALQKPDLLSLGATCICSKLTLCAGCPVLSVARIPETQPAIKKAQVDEASL